MLDELLRFTEFLNKLRLVERAVLANGARRRENDVEHSYHLAMLAWYIVSSEKLSLNLEKVLMYALSHDLIEVYAGDTYLYSEDQALLDSKEGRERDALIQMKDEFAEVPDILAAIEGYQTKADREARFVYALDKIEPVIKIYLDGGRTWREKNISLDMLIEKKQDKVRLSPDIVPYYDELIALLREKEGELFR